MKIWAPWKDLGQKADSEMWVRKMKWGGWTGDGRVGLELRTQGGYGWDPGGCGLDYVDEEDSRGQGHPGGWILLLRDWIWDVRVKELSVTFTPRGGWVEAPGMPSETWWTEGWGGGVRMAREICKVHSALTREHSSSFWTQRAGFTSPRDRPGCVRSRTCLCPVDVKHVSHFCLFKASFGAACCSPLHPTETSGFRQEWSS